MVKKVASIAAKGLSTAFGLFLVLAVLFTTVQVFLYFASTDAVDRPSFEETLEIIERKNDIALTELAQSDNEESVILSGTVKYSMCNLIGYYCNGTDGYNSDDYEGSILGIGSKIALMPYSVPPASGFQYVAQGLDRVGLVPDTLAAENNTRGLGFSSINPLLPVWKALRNVSFLLLVLIILIIGFLVMFRTKIDAQTAISIESALPKIVITILLISFSFAIAGFLIDFMYISIIFLITLVGGVKIPTPDGSFATFDTKYLLSEYLFASIGDIFGVLSGETQGALTCVDTAGMSAPCFTASSGPHLAFSNLFWYFPTALIKAGGFYVNVILRIIGAVAIHNWVIAPLVAKVGKTLSIQLGWAGGPLVNADGLINTLISLVTYVKGAWIGLLLVSILLPLFIGVLLTLTVVFLGLKLIFYLLSAYIQIIILITLSPLILLREAIPGSGAFKSWFKNLFAEIMTFPILIGIFLLATVIIQSGVHGMDCGGNPFNNDDCTMLGLPFLWGFNPQSMTIIIGMSILFMAPELIEKVKNFLNPQSINLPKPGFSTFLGGAPMMAAAGLGAVGKYFGPDTQKSLVKNIGRRFPFFNPLLNKLGLGSTGGGSGATASRNAANPDDFMPTRT